MEKQLLYARLEENYFSEDMHERAEIRDLPRILGRTRLFVDVGASLGQYTYFADRHLEGARIIAIEADPTRFERLAKNCEQWSLGSRNTLQPLHAAVDDEAGSARFHVSHSTISGGLFKPLNPARTREGDAGWSDVEVPSVTLDDVLAHESTGVVKMDVEGGEYRALRGATETLRRGTFTFLVEVHSWGDPTRNVGPADVHALFRAFGYRSVKLHHHHLFVPGARWPRLFLASLGGRVRRLPGRLWRRLAGALRAVRAH